MRLRSQLAGLLINHGTTESHWWAQPSSEVLPPLSGGDAGPQKVSTSALALRVSADAVPLERVAKREKKSKKNQKKKSKRQNPAPLAALPSFRMLFISALLFLLVSRQSDRVCEINFRGGKLLIIYLQLGRARRRERRAAVFGFSS